MEKERAIAYSRFQNKKYLKKNKANRRIGGYWGYFDSVESKCQVCGCTIWFLDKKEDIDDLLEKDAKEICIGCVLKDKKAEMTKEQREMLTEMLEKYKKEKDDGNTYDT